MVRAILADVNIEGHVRRLVTLMEGEPWREFWESLALSLRLFRDFGLAADASDVVVWELCQREQLILLTANRNEDAPDSLEATLRARNTATSLPVMTVASADNILQSRKYADRLSTVCSAICSTSRKCAAPVGCTFRNSTAGRLW
jgi:hypothetical protein